MDSQDCLGGVGGGDGFPIGGVFTAWDTGRNFIPGGGGATEVLGDFRGDSSDIFST